MQNVLVSFGFVVSLHVPASAQTWAAHQQPVAAAHTVQVDPATVGALSSALVPSLEEKAAASLALQEAFDARLLDRGQRALASLCDRCGVQQVRPLSRRARVTSPVLSSHLPDAETIYAPGSGFDPAQARVD